MKEVGEFFAAYNRLHKTMMEVTGREDDSFGSLLTYMNAHNPVIRHYYQQLDTIRELRNLLTHEKLSSDYELAYPSEEVVAFLDMVRKKLRSPGTAGQKFSGQVESLFMYQPLQSLFDLVNRENITKFPIFDKKGLSGVLSDNGITNWLARVAKDGIVDFHDYSIEDMVGRNGDFDRSFKNFRVVSPETSLYEVEEIFAKELLKGKNPFVILLSTEENISSPSQIKGIITQWDLPQVRKEL